MTSSTFRSINSAAGMLVVGPRSCALADEFVTGFEKRGRYPTVSGISAYETEKAG
jgi:hypothetical protein